MAFFESVNVLHGSFKPFKEKELHEEKYSELSSLTLRGGRPCSRSYNAVLFPYRHILWGEARVLWTGSGGKLLSSHLAFPFPHQQKSLQKLSAGLLLSGLSYNQLWMHRKKPAGLPRCSGAESRSSTCPTKSASSTGISKIWNWPSASSTSASSYCRTIRYLRIEGLLQSPACEHLSALCILQLLHSGCFFISFFIFWGPSTF